MLPNCSEAKTPTPPSHSAQSSREGERPAWFPKKMSQTLGNAASHSLTRFLSLFLCFFWYHSLVCYLNFDGIVHTSNAAANRRLFSRSKRSADAEYSSLPSLPIYSGSACISIDRSIWRNAELAFHHRWPKDAALWLVLGLIGLSSWWKRNKSIC